MRRRSVIEVFFLLGEMSEMVLASEATVRDNTVDKPDQIGARLPARCELVI
jgi:hypothetical protein